MLKPINPKRFAQAIEKVNTNLIERAEKNEKKLALDNQIFIRDGEKCWLVKISDIYLFEVDGNYTKVFFQNEKATINKSLNQIEEKLPEKYFFRANRNQIVNVQYIGKIETWFSGNLLAELPKDIKVEISRRQASNFNDKLSL